MITLLLLMMFAGRQYHSVSIEKMAANRHTHVEIVGFITMMKREEDGDTHVRLCTSRQIRGMDRARCIVAEFIPGCAIAPTLKVGQKVRVWGISRFDREANHNWYECHVCEGAEVLP